MKLSAIIITRNEQNNIVDCLKTLKFADQIIVIDNESVDNTARLAKDEGVKVYQIGGLDFSYLRNLGKEKSTNEWILYIDADERVTPDLAVEIKNTIEGKNTCAAYTLRRSNYFLGKLWPKEEAMLRLMKKESLIGWQGALHESPIVIGSIGHLRGILLHYTHRNLTSMVDKTNQWSEIEAQLRFQNNHPSMQWWRFIRVMLTTFWQYYAVQGGWRIGMVGLIESIYQSFSIFISYAKLWERQNNMQIKTHYKANKDE